MSKPPEVYRIHDGSADYFVRGTLDETEAFKMIEEEYEDDFPEIDEEFDYDVEYCLDLESKGYWRFNVQPPGSDYAWVLAGPREAKRPGWFPGIFANVTHREIVFESDVEAL